MKTRILSSALLLPPVLGAIWLGGYAYLALVAIFGGAMTWELNRLSGDVSRLRGGIAAAIGVLCPVAHLVSTWTGGLWVAIGTAAMAMLMLRGELPPSVKGAIAVASFFVLLTLFSLVWLRGSGTDGLVTVFWLVGTIAGTDIGAYFAGRAIGGPKLAPAISPNKTWAGLAGGTLLAGIVGLLFGLGTGGPAVVQVLLTSALLAPVAQAGDLFESWIKRQVGAKDSGALIPGHGGVLDRADGYLTATPAVALIALMHEGSLLTWP